MTDEERRALIAGIEDALWRLSPWLLKLEAQRHGVGEIEEYSVDAGRPHGGLEELGKREGIR